MVGGVGGGRSNWENLGGSSMCLAPPELEELKLKQILIRLLFLSWKSSVWYPFIPSVKNARGKRISEWDQGKLSQDLWDTESDWGVLMGIWIKLRAIHSVIFGLDFVWMGNNLVSNLYIFPQWPFGFLAPLPSSGRMKMFILLQVLFLCFSRT